MLRTVVRTDDCLGDDGLGTLGEDSVDHAIFDPPYSDHVHANARVTPGATTENDRKNPVVERVLGYDALTDDVRDRVLAHCARAVRRWTIAFCDVESAGDWKRAGERAGLDWVRAVPWVKPNAQPNLHGLPGNACEMLAVMHSPRRAPAWNGGGKARFYDHLVLDRGDSRFHPEQKPLELMEAVVLDFTSPGDLVVDPFAGSGSTLVAAVLHGRRARGWEKDARHAARANARIAVATKTTSR